MPIFIRTAIIAALFQFSLSEAAAQPAPEAWPTKAVVLVLPFAADHNINRFVRQFSTQLSRQLAVPVVIENKPHSAVSATDTHTYWVGGIEQMVNRSPADAALAMIGMSPHVICANFPAEFNVGNLELLVGVLRQHPGRFKFGIAALGSASHVAATVFQAYTKTVLVPQVYASENAVLNAMASGEVQLAFEPISVVQNDIAGTTTTAISIAFWKRSQRFPNVATTSEFGLPGYEFSSWYGLFGAKDAPPAITARMKAESEGALEAPHLKSFWRDNGMDRPTVAGFSIDSFVKIERRRWTDFADRLSR